MKLRALLSVVSLIFSSNFTKVIDSKDYEKLAKNWLLQTDTLECKKGNELYLHKDEYEKVVQDFERLQAYFDLSIFMKIDNFKLAEFYSVVNYERIIQPCKISSMLFYIAQALKENKDRDLKKFLSSYFLASAKDFVFVLNKEAKSNYYKALSYFLQDFLYLLKMIEE